MTRKDSNTHQPSVLERIKLVSNPQTKTCKRCELELSIEDFRLRKDNGKPRGSCRECEREMSRIRNERFKKNNPHKQKEYNEKRDKEKQKGYNKQYYKDNPDRFNRNAKEVRRAYYLRHPERTMLSQARTRAQRNGLPFDLEERDIHIPKVCPVLKIALIAGEGSMHDGSPTLDRKIPDLGYVKGNVAVISNKANRLKSNGTSLEIQAVLEYVKKIEEENT